MKKIRAFTIVELVIVLAVSSILFAIIAGISALVQGTVVSQKSNTNGTAEYFETKNKIEQFMSSYNYDEYTVELNSETELFIYLTSEVELESKSPVAKIEYNDENKIVSFYELALEELTQTNAIELKVLTNLTFKIDIASNLLMVSVNFENDTNYKFLINLGGTQIGNLY